MYKYLTQIIRIIISIIFLLVFISGAIISPIIEKKNWYITLILGLAAAIDAVFFLMPIFQSIKTQNRIFNKLQINCFTDRETELKQVCELLSTWSRHSINKPIHIICKLNAAGKTFFLLKIWNTLTSFTNFCKVMNFKKYNLNALNTWFNLNKIVYIDCNDDSDETIHLKNKNNKYIRGKSIYLFDNLNQNFYDTYIKNHNLTRYICTGELNSDNYDKIILGNFGTKEVNEFYNKLKMQKNVSFIRHFDKEICEDSIQKIVNITCGNIKEISSIFDNKNTINYIMNFEENEDEKQKIIDKVTFKMLIGSYTEALNLLEANKSNLLDPFIFRFKYYEKHAHCLHLLNRYEEAIEELNFLRVSLTDSNLVSAIEFYNKDNILELHLAHYYKHMGNFEEALTILNDLNTTNSSFDKLGILAADYFIKGNNPDTFLNVYESLLKCKLNEEFLNKLYRYSPIYYYLKTGELEDKELKQCLNYYEENKDHLIANALFMQAEIYRLSKEYKKAKKLYLDCLDYSLTFKDKNLQLQVSLIINYCLNTNKFKLKDNSVQGLLNYPTIKHIANEFKMEYNYSCANLFNSVNLNDPDSNDKKRQIDSRIFVIL